MQNAGPEREQNHRPEPPKPDQPPKDPEPDPETSPWDREDEPSGFLGGVTLTGVALFAVTALAGIAIGYIIGSSSPDPVPAITAAQQPPPAQDTTRPPAQAPQQATAGQAVPQFPVTPSTAPQQFRPPAPGFNATTMTGQQFDIAATRGSPTLIVFW